MATSYDAFISYSHAADGRLAPELENALEGFAKPWYRRRALSLFRDQTSLSASPGLWPSIEQALSSSRYFLLLASPRAAASRWVQQEVAWWLEHKSPQTLLIGLTDGQIKRPEGATDFDWEQTDALPPNLKGVFTENPLWVDFRWAQGQEQLSTKHPEFQNALAALAAPLRNIPKEDLIGEDVRQHRRALLLARGAALVLIGLLVLAVWQWRVAEFQTTVAVRAQATAEAEQARAEEQARISLTRALAAQAVTETERGEHERGALLARQAYLVDEESGGAVRDRVDAALRAALGVPYFSPILRGHEGGVSDVAFAPDGRTLASGSDDETVRVWDLDQPKSDPIVLEGPGAAISAVAFGPDGRTLASGDDWDGAVRLWDLDHPEAEPTVLEGHEGGISDVAFAPDGRTLASGGDDGMIRVWDLDQPEAPTLVLESHGDSVTTVAFAPNGRLLASGSVLFSPSLEGTVRLWDLTNPADPLVLESDENWVNTVAIAPDGRLLASGSSDETVRVWDLDHPEVDPIVLEGHERGVLSVAFASDGRTLASGGSDETVRVWDLDKAAPVVLSGHEGAVWSVAFAPDGRLASGGDDGMIRLWIARTDTLADLVCTRVWRNLTLDEWRQFIGDPEQVPYQPTCPNLPPSEGIVMATPSISTPAAQSVVLPAGLSRPEPLDPSKIYGGWRAP